MTQPINPLSAAGVRAHGQPATPTVAGRAGAARGGEPGAEGRDVALSGTARALAEATAAIADTPEVDMDKVERIRSAIASGTYHIDPQAVARKFMAIEGELARDR